MSAIATLAGLMVAGQGDPFFSSVGYLLHGDGANNGTVFTNNGPTGVAPTRSGTGIVTSTAWFEFGTASIRSPAASGNKLQFPNSDVYRGTGSNWTFETTLYRDVAGTTQVLMDGNNNATNTNGPIIYINTANKLTLYAGAQGVDYGGGGTSIPINTLTKIAVTWDGTTLRFYVNGVLDQSATGFTNGWGSTSGPCLFGDKNASILQCYRGWADETRFTRVARYTGVSYTVATAPFPNS